MRGIERKTAIRKSIFVIIALLLGAYASAAGPPGTAGPEAPHAVGELLVKFRSSMPAHERTAAARGLGAERIRDFAMPGLQHVKLPPGMTVAEGVRMFQRNPNVEYAEPNYIIKAEAVPNDPQFGSQWGLDKISAPAAWDIINSTGVTVAVLDTGIDHTHPDLAANIWRNPGETNCTNGLDDDNNGFVDDCIGWDFANKDNDPMDDSIAGSLQGHGTLVAGVIGAVGNNGTGIAGVSWQVMLMPLKFMDARGDGFISDAISGIQYARANGADIVNCSWGVGVFSNALKSAIEAAPGMLFTCAAGNSGLDTDTTTHSPSGFDSPNILAVAATDQDDDLASFSNFGPVSVDLGAPGVDILSTVVGNSPSGDYDSASGTSFSAPHAAGAAALLMAARPSLNTLEIKHLVIESVDPLPSLDGRTVSGGRLNAFEALQADLSTLPPVPPSDLTAALAAVQAGPSIQLAWTDNSSLEDGFIVERKVLGERVFSQIDTLAANVTSFLDTGLVRGLIYTYRLRAFNNAGPSPPSDEAMLKIPAPSDGGGGCFIATAAWGSALAPEVEALRRFRDERLLTNAPGRFLVRLYYRYSPPLAAYISGRPGLRRAARLAIAPAVYSARYPWAATALLSMIVSALFYAAWRKRKTIRRRH